MKRVLLIEDDHILAALVSKALDESGHTVVIAASIEAAIVAFDREPPQVIVSDFALPDGTLHDFLQRRPVKVPVVAVSQHRAARELNHPALVSKLPKPFTFGNLLTAVDEAFKYSVPSAR